MRIIAEVGVVHVVYVSPTSTYLASLTSLQECVCVCECVCECVCVSSPSSSVNALLDSSALSHGCLVALLVIRALSSAPAPGCLVPIGAPAVKRCVDSLLLV